MKKLKTGAVAKSVAKRLIHPGHLVRAVKLQRGRKQNKRVYQDAQLALVAQILPEGFLHYGYFDDPARCPEGMSLQDLVRAQHRYAELLIERVTDLASPVLDVGCGMGGLSKMLLDRGMQPTALTPDRIQAEHIRRAYPKIPVIQAKFEDLPDPDSHAGRYGTVVTSESLQYLKLDRALPLLAKVLKPGGRWIACDYFRIGQVVEKSGHDWGEFRKRLAGEGWEIAHEQDITPNVLPTLRFLHMLASRFGIPLMHFGFLKLRTKQPAVHYVLEETLSMLEGVVAENLKVIDPAVFAAGKKYVLLEMRRAP